MSHIFFIHLVKMRVFMFLCEASAKMHRTAPQFRRHRRRATCGLAIPQGFRCRNVLRYGLFFATFLSNRKRLRCVALWWKPRVTYRPSLHPSVRLNVPHDHRLLWSSRASENSWTGGVNYWL